MSDLQESVRQHLSADGWTVHGQGDALIADKTAIRSQWPLGRHTVKHQVRVDMDRTTRQLTLQETAMDVTTGMAPPSLSRTVTQQHGTKRTERREEAGPDGGGVLRYGEPGQWIEQACLDHGWAFQQKIGSG